MVSEDMVLILEVTKADMVVKWVDIQDMDLKLDMEQDMVVLKQVTVLDMVDSNQVRYSIRCTVYSN
jgi:hypothetical protein